MLRREWGWWGVWDFGSWRIEKKVNTSLGDKINELLKSQVKRTKYIFSTQYQNRTDDSSNPKVHLPKAAARFPVGSANSREINFKDFERK